MASTDVRQDHTEGREREGRMEDGRADEKDGRTNGAGISGLCSKCNMQHRALCIGLQYLARSEMEEKKLTIHSANSM